MPSLVMVRYSVPHTVALERVDIASLPNDWVKFQGLTQTIGDEWHRSMRSAVLLVPSAVLPIPGAPDVNAVLNHRHPDASKIERIDASPFVMDTRLL
jgi:RES domain-containing protein